MRVLHLLLLLHRQMILRRRRRRPVAQALVQMVVEVDLVEDVVAAAVGGAVRAQDDLATMKQRRRSEMGRENMSLKTVGLLMVAQKQQQQQRSNRRRAVGGNSRTTSILKIESVVSQLIGICLARSSYQHSICRINDMHLLCIVGTTST
jgi:hypothetical protein